MRLPISKLAVAFVVAAQAVVVSGAVVTAQPAGAAVTQVWRQESAGWNRSSSPAIADINGDGTNEIVVGHQDGLLRVLKADGSPVAGWPQPVVISGNTPTAIDSSPAIGDLDGDGKPEIVVGAGSTWVQNQHGGVVAFRADGTVLFRWQAADEFTVWGMIARRDGYSEGVFSTPAIGDVDGDGKNDVVFGGWDMRIHALDRTGKELPGFPVWNDDTIWASPVLYDVDSDGRLEILIGGASTLGGQVPWDGGVFRMIDYRNGTPVVAWQAGSAEVFDSSPALGDIDGDGRMEVVTASGAYYDNADSRKIYAWHADDGSPVPGWPVSVSGIVMASVAIGDVSHDDGGKPEVIVGSWDGSVWALRGTGQVLWKRQTDGGIVDGRKISNSPIIADLDGNGTNDVGIGNSYAYFILNGSTGTVQQTVADWQSYEGSAALGNFGSAGWRLLINSFDTPGNRSWFTAYSVPAPKVDPPWPIWRKNLRRLGAAPSDGTPLPPWQCSKSVNPPGNPDPNSGKGYWVLLFNGTVQAFGAPHLGDLATAGVPGNAIGLAETPDGAGYWIVKGDGRVFAFGTARHHGDAAGQGHTIVSIARTRTGLGYWLLTSGGRVIPFGDARHFGDPSAMQLNQPVIAMTATADDGGYWVLALDGGIFSYGNATFYGSAGAMRLNAPVISMSSTATGKGYWLLARDGGMFAYGDARFHGSAPGLGLCSAPNAIELRRTASGRGYFTLMADGGIYSYGDAAFFGASPGAAWFNPPVDIVVRL